MGCEDCFVGSYSVCEVAFPSAVHPSLVLNIGLLRPFLAKEAEQTKATITRMLCRVRDSPSKPEAQAHGVGAVGLGRTLVVRDPGGTLPWVLWG